MTSAPDFEETRAVPRSADDDTLPLGARLRDYEITGLIGERACSIVYLAWDHSLQRKVAIKEYMPSSMAVRVSGSSAIVVESERQLDTFKTGLKSFVNEARLLAQFDHPSLVKVYRFWEENGTAYMVMPYYEGPTLKAALAELGHVPSESELRAWLKPILNAVTVLHEGQTWHQNIGPDAILLTPVGPVLLGFAAAAHAIEAMNHTPAAALRPGFAAIEQYGSEAGTTRGPCTDLYALAATVYTAITGAEPAPAADRLAHDRVRPLSVVASGLYSEGFLAAIDAAMAIQPQQRPADHAEFRALMGDIEAPETVSLTPRRDLMQEPFLLPPDDEREITVPDRPAAAVTEPPPVQRAPLVAAAKPARATPAVDAPSPAGAERSLPSWMASGGSPAAGKRVLYGVVAGTCALIGIAALVLQFATRTGARAPAVVAASSALARAASAVPAAPRATTALASAPSTSPPRPVVASASVAPPVPVPVPVVAVVRAPAPAPAPAPAIASAPIPAVASHAPTQIAAASSAPVAPTDPIQRQTRCIEILQKASLEKITAAETEYFKKECK